MAIHIALLRAVNVGGTGALPMAVLKSACEDLGFTGVQTYIQSGNVVFQCAWAAGRVKKALESALSALVGKHVDVLMRTPRELEEILGRNPFGSKPAKRVLVNFFHQAVDAVVLASVKILDGEELHASGRELYVHYPEGLGRTRLNLSKLGVATARNINTVAKLDAMAKTSRAK